MPELQELHGSTVGRRALPVRIVAAAHGPLRPRSQAWAWVGGTAKHLGVPSPNHPKWLPAGMALLTEEQSAGPAGPSSLSLPRSLPLPWPQPYPQLHPQKQASGSRTNK